MSEQRLSRTRVLLVDSEPRAGMALRDKVAAGLPAEMALTATTPAQAVRELARHGACCVLALADAGEDQPAIVAQLCAAAPETPVIVLAQPGDERTGIAAIRAGAQDHLPAADLTPRRLQRAIAYATERKRAEVALALRALHDPLTALPNRALFCDRLTMALDRAQRSGEPVTVLFLDVDGFKAINDTLGHADGDRLLVTLAARFRGMLRPMDTVARFGGDEFTFLLEGLTEARDATHVARRIGRRAGVPLTLSRGREAISVSIGVTVVDDPAVTADEAIARADEAMYRAKRLGGGCVQALAASGRSGTQHEAGAAQRADQRWVA